MGALHKRTPPEPWQEGGAAETEEDAKSNSSLSANAGNSQAKVIAKSATAEVRVSLRRWRGEHKVDVREFTATIPGVFMSTASGITLAVAKLPEFIAALQMVERDAKARGLIGGA